jgi:hypothetical protein
LRLSFGFKLSDVCSACEHARLALLILVMCCEINYQHIIFQHTQRYDKIRYDMRRYDTILHDIQVIIANNAAGSAIILLPCYILSAIAFPTMLAVICL